MTSPGNPPLVSIGLPVFNGAHHLPQTLEALRRQTLTDYEVLISDNASTDGTEAICRAMADADPRVRYHRNAENLGAAANFQHVAEMATGRYFIWLAHHDRWAPQMLERCVAEMEADPQVVLCHSGAMAIDDEAREIGCLALQPDTRGLTVRQRYRSAIWRLHCYTIYGLLRREALASVLPVRKTMGSDSVLLAELSLIGSFAHVPDPLFYFRTLSTVGDLKAGLKRLGITLNLWTAPGVFLTYAREMFAVIKRRAPRAGLRWALRATLALRLTKAAVGFFGSLTFAACCPRLYRKMVTRIVQRRSANQPTVTCNSAPQRECHERH